MKFLHAADLHLDSPLRGLERYEGAPVDRLRDATRRAFENLVDLCLDEAVDLVVLAGDLYDGDWRDYNTGLFFVNQVRRLRAGGARVFLVRGNHDAASSLTRSLRLPEGVHDFSCDQAETRVLESLGVAVHGRGYATRAVDEDLSLGYPPPVPDLFNIGLLHTSADGREGHESYAPCRLAGLVNKGYDYWALGHVHKREVLHVRPWVVFAGNPQGRHARETGAKGATLVTVDDRRVRSVEARTLDVVRWSHLTIDVSDAVGGHDVVDEVRAHVIRAQREAEGRMLAARVVLTGSPAAHAALAGDAERWKQEIRAAASDAGGGEVWVEKVVIKTRPPLDASLLFGRDDPVGGLLRSLREMRTDGAALEWAWNRLADLRRKLPSEYQGEGALPLDRPEGLCEVLDDVEQLLIAQLLAAETPR